MRLMCCALIFAASCLPAFAQGAAPQPPAPPAQQYDVPATPSYVAILTKDFAPGQSAGRHIHHGVEMTVVVRGDFELDVDGHPSKVYHAGDSFIVPRDVPHDGKNVGATTVTLAVTYVNDKGTPLRENVK